MATGNHDHPSDEHLLAHRDGELGDREARRVERHLRLCWQCSARLQRLEETLCIVVDAYQAQRYPSYAAVEEARDRLRRDVLTMQAAADAAARRGIPRLRVPWKAGLAAALALSAAAMVYLPRIWTSQPPVSRQHGTTPGRVASLAKADPAVSRVEPPPPARSAAVAPVAAEADATPVEIAALFALHDLGVCRGASVQVQRMDGEVRVTGVVENAERRDEIVRALQAAAPAARVHLQVVPWEVAYAQEFSSYNPEPEALPSTVATGRIRPHEALRAYLRSKGVNDADLGREITAFADAAFQYSAEALTDASALHELSIRWPVDGSRPLDPASLRLLRKMVMDHYERVDAQIRSLERMLQSAFPAQPLQAEPSATAQDEEPADWRAAAEKMLGQLLFTHQLVAGLFAGDRLPPATSEDMSPALLLNKLGSSVAELPRFCETLASALADGAQPAQAAGGRPRRNLPLRNQP